ncbi:MAG TPA: hypothetical protein HA362_03345 [Nanoarchaeota archaeon]|nr:hypothetical protein [Nanoarchaeota archaeon]
MEYLIPAGKTQAGKQTILENIVNISGPDNLISINGYLTGMAEYDFWANWRNKSEIEKKAIDSVKKAMALVIGSVPQNALVAIYIKGSFARREMKEGSDVDMVPIVAENKYEGAVFGVNSPEIEPVCVVPLSLWEFRHNKLFTKGNYTPDLRAEPDLFLKKLDEFKLIYGQPLDAAQFPIREDRGIMRSEIHKIREGYIPAYREGVIDFLPLLKEVFWLAELEQALKGKRPGHSFNGIVKSVNSTHIAHAAFGLRKKRVHNKAEEKRFISQLNRYLAELENLV